MIVKASKCYDKAKCRAMAAMVLKKLGVAATDDVTVKFSPAGGTSVRVHVREVVARDLTMGKDRGSRKWRDFEDVFDDAELRTILRPGDRGFGATLTGINGQG